MISSCIFYYIIVTTTSLVQSLNSAHLNSIKDDDNTGFYKSFLPQKSNEHNVRFVSNKNDNYNKDLFIDENNSNLELKQNEIMPQLVEIKSLLLQLIDRIDSDKDKREAKHQGIIKRKDTVWGRWSNWSSCSVSCGRGREIRWRRCLENCQGVDTEMAEKLCQLPACPSKLFGLIKL